MNKHWHNRERVKQILKAWFNEEPEQCASCGVNEIEWHHCIGGTGNRKKSDEFSLIVRLCPTHHRDHTKGVHHNKNLDLHYKRQAQHKFELAMMLVDYTVFEAREIFINEFGRNYIE